MSKGEPMQAPKVIHDFGLGLKHSLVGRNIEGRPVLHIARDLGQMSNSEQTCGAVPSSWRTMINYAVKIETQLAGPQQWYEHCAFTY